MRNVSSREYPSFKPNGYGISKSPLLLGEPSLARDSAATASTNVINSDMMIKLQNGNFL